ncbi:MAG: zinc ribbon domain-containing protein, partial [Gammaproteobacteria bacterium]
IRWAQYEQNLEQLKANTAQSMGTPRRGPSLLSGLLICGRCGLRMATLRIPLKVATDSGVKSATQTT